MPRTQKYQKIGFVLEGVAHWLVIRPAELTIDEPSRSNVHQTLGGAWADVFGAGVGSINISGTTGWGSNKQYDGFLAWKDLHENVWRKWAKLVERSDPELVRLDFVDELDEQVFRVIPDKFQLKRNKSNPLLHNFNISMTILEIGGIGSYLIDEVTEGIYNDRQARIDALARLAAFKEPIFEDFVPIGAHAETFYDAAGVAGAAAKKAVESNTVTDATSAMRINAAIGKIFRAAAGAVVYAAREVLVAESREIMNHVIDIHDGVFKDVFDSIEVIFPEIGNIEDIPRIIIETTANEIIAKVLGEYVEMQPDMDILARALENIINGVKFK